MYMFIEELKSTLLFVVGQLKRKAVKAADRQAFRQHLMDLAKAADEDRSFDISRIILWTTVQDMQSKRVILIPLLSELSTKFFEPDLSIQVRWNSKENIRECSFDGKTWMSPGLVRGPKGSFRVSTHDTITTARKFLNERHSYGEPCHDGYTWPDKRENRRLGMHGFD